MTEKEKNMAILDQLYNIALGVWSLMEKHITGSFTASEVCKLIDKELQWGENDEEQKHEVTIGDFHCEFPTKKVFQIVGCFENLARIGNKCKLFVAEEKGETVGSVTFKVSKIFKDLCKFAGDKYCLNPALQNILIDTERNCLVATDGQRMKVQPVTIFEKSGDTKRMLINAKDFGRMCSKMKGKFTYRMTARKEKVDYDEVTKVKFEGVSSGTRYDYVYPQWASVFQKKSRELCVSVLDWQSVCSFMKTNDVRSIGIKGNKGENHVTFEAGKSDELYVDFASGTSTMKSFVGDTIKHSFHVFFSKSTLMTVQSAGIMTLWLGTKGNIPVQACDGTGVLYIFMPCKDDNAYVGERVGDDIVAPQVENDMDLLQLYAPVADAESMDVPTEKSDKPKKKQTASKTVVDGSRKFTFAKVGLSVGDSITFVDSKEVIIASDTEVTYCGENYTLSGFCKKFMPEEKRCKSNSYRGCAFFYKDGVKLEKMLKEALKQSAETKAVQEAAPDVESVAFVPVETTALTVAQTETKEVAALAQNVQSMPLVQPVRTACHTGYALFTQDALCRAGSGRHKASAPLVRAVHGNRMGNVRPYSSRRGALSAMRHRSRAFMRRCGNGRKRGLNEMPLPPPENGITEYL